jgi:hypothetical protein
MSGYIRKGIRCLIPVLLFLAPFSILAQDGNSTELLTEDIYPAWTQVHFEVGPDAWATIVLSENGERLVSVSFAVHGKRFDIPKPCLDDIRNPALETAQIGFGVHRGWLRFKTTTFDENGTGQEQKDMAIVRFDVEAGLLVSREVIEEKGNNYTKWESIDLSKGLKQSDIDADRCGDPVMFPKVKVS